MEILETNVIIAMKISQVRIKSKSEIVEERVVNNYRSVIALKNKEINMERK